MTEVAMGSLAHILGTLIRLVSFHFERVELQFQIEQRLLVLLSLDHALLHFELGFELKVFHIGLLVIDLLLLLLKFDWTAMFVARVHILVHLKIIKTKFVLVDAVSVLDHTIE